MGTSLTPAAGLDRLQPSGIHRLGLRVRLTAMQEILPGVWHWTAFHEPISTDVSSYYLDAARIVVDPKVPPEGLPALPSEPEQVVLMTGLHHRDAQRFA